MKTALILLNGLRPKSLPALTSFDLVCAVDGAYSYFEENDLQPDLVTGDFDSIERLPNSVEVLNTPDQDLTDFEKALQVLFERGIRSVAIYGGSGNESDHFLGNISVALAWKEKLTLQFFDEFGRFYFIPSAYSLSNVLGCTISLIPFPTAAGITTSGLEYPLLEEDLSFGTRIGTRNKAISESISIHFKTGNLLLYISNDA